MDKNRIKSDKKSDKIGKSEKIGKIRFDLNSDSRALVEAVVLSCKVIGIELTLKIFIHCQSKTGLWLMNEKTNPILFSLRYRLRARMSMKC